MMTPSYGPTHPNIPEPRYAPRTFLGYALLRHLLGVPQVCLVTLDFTLFRLLTHICLVTPCNQWLHTDVLLQVNGLLPFAA